MNLRLYGQTFMVFFAIFLLVWFSASYDKRWTMKNPCNEDCENYDNGCCYDPCGKRIVYTRLFIEFDGFKLSSAFSEYFSAYGEFDSELNLIRISSKRLRDIEKTLSHEIEHGLLYHLLKKLGCNDEQANFGNLWISNPSLGDKQTILILTYHCEICHRKLTKQEIENGFSLDGENLICEKCENNIKISKVILTTKR